MLQNWAEGDTLDSLTSHGSIQIRATPRQGLISLNLLYSCFKKGATLSHTKSSAPLISQPAVLACYLLRYYPFISICLSVCLSLYLSIYHPALPRAGCCVTCQIQVIVCTQQDVPRVEPEVILVPGKASGALRGFSLVLALISQWTRSCCTDFKEALRLVQ